MTDSLKGSALAGYRILPTIDNGVGVMEEDCLQGVLHALAGFTNAWKVDEKCQSVLLTGIFCCRAFHAQF
jgi:hypothetical protein